MKLEDQCCSLELAKRLKELEVKQVALCHWFWVVESDNPQHWPGHIKPKDHFDLGIGRPVGSYLDDVWQGGETYAAFTVAELGEVLPQWVGSHKNGTNWDCLTDTLVPEGVELVFFNNVKEADARAKMLIHLIEKGIVKP